MKFLATAIVLAAFLTPALPARAAAIAKSTLGCKTPGDVTKTAALKGGALDAASRPLVASGACTFLAKGASVDVDEEKSPLSCVRLTGDLSCLWVQSALIDQHPGEKGSGGGQRGGGRSHRG